jgi:hypothetical protein
VNTSIFSTYVRLHCMLNFHLSSFIIKIIIRSRECCSSMKPKLEVTTFPTLLFFRWDGLN